MRIIHRLSAAAVSAALVLSFGTGAASAAFEEYIDTEAIVSEEKTAVNSSIRSAAAELREHLAARDESFSITVSYGLVTDTSQLDDMLNIALEETDSPKQGDYIRFNFYSFGYSTSNNSAGKGMDINFTVAYNASASQEAQVDKAVAELSNELRLSGLNEYEKCASVCTWIRNNVVYDDQSSERSIFSAYGALIKRRAVCQGISALVYRILRQNGVDCRIIPGQGNGSSHAWNIVNIDGKWYYLDATWDAQTNTDSYLFFLRGNNDFDSLAQGNTHVPGSIKGNDSPIYNIYKNGQFDKECPAEKYSYAPLSMGDVDKSGTVTSTDASMVLKAYAGLSTTGCSGFTNAQSRAADVFSRCTTDSNCASAILAYYGYLSTSGTASMETFIKKYK